MAHHIPQCEQEAFGPDLDDVIVIPGRIGAGLPDRLHSEPPQRVNRFQVREQGALNLLKGLVLFAVGNLAVGDPPSAPREHL